MEKNTFGAGAWFVTFDVTASPSSEAADLLLQLLELPAPGLSAAVVQDLHVDAAALLISSGFLKPDGHEAAVVLDDLGAGPTTATWDPDTSSYRAFNAHEGWINVASDRLTRYSVDLPRVFSTLTAQLASFPGAVCREMIPGVVWDLGDRRLAGRAHRLPVWFARRLSFGQNWNLFNAAARAQPPAHDRLIVTSTPAAVLPELALPRHHFAALDRLVADLADLSISAGSLLSLLDGQLGATAAADLVVVGDGRHVQFYGRTFSFPKGDTQRRIIVKLYEYYLTGEKRVASAQIVTDLDLDPSTRMRDIFKRSPAWGALLDERNGMLGFCLKQDDPAA